LKQVVRDDPDDVLFDTLYRYLVLFGCPADNPSKSTAVWNILMRHLRFSEDTRSSRKSHDVRAQYITDHNRYGLWHGCETIIRQARERLEQCPGAREILNGLLSFNPKARPTMKSILLSPLFDNLLLNNEDIRKGDLIFNHYSLKKYGSKIFDV
jgi:serine/threonine protein kinase